MEPILWSVDPLFFSFGMLKIHWYGLLFATAILSGLHIIKRIYRYENLPEESLEDLFLYVVIGIVVGARLAHCLFYDPAYYLSNPSKIFAVWEGGLASHGGGLGALIGAYLYAKKEKLNYVWLIDRVAIPTALFGFFVRMGNLMNSEIVGKPTEGSWGVIFTRVDMLVRHPVQVYEALSYLAIFFLLVGIYLWSSKAKQRGFLFGTFLLSVFSARFVLEFFKMKQASYESLFSLSTGQLLSIPFLFLGIWMIYSSNSRVTKK